MGSQQGGWSIFARICAVTSGAAGAIAVAGWATDRITLTALGAKYIPMAPSTAILFIFLGSALFSIESGSSLERGSRAAAAAGLLATAVGLVVIVEFIARVDAGVESIFGWGAGRLGAIPTGKMSPIAAACFLMSGLSVFVMSLPEGRRGRAVYAAAGMSIVVASIGSAVAVSYLAGNPFLYGGPVIPMAMPTSAAFFLLGAGILAAAAPGRMPEADFGHEPRAGFRFPARYLAVFTVFCAGMALSVVIATVLGRLESRSPHHDWDVWSVMIGGFLLTSLLSVGFFAREKHLAKIESSEKRFRSITDAANDAIITADGNGRIISWNRAAERIFGYATAEALGKQVSILVPESLRGAHLKGMEEAYKSGRSSLTGKTTEVAGLRSDGTEFPAEVSLSRWSDNDGVFFSAIIRDVTARRAAEAEREKLIAELQESIASVKTLSDLLPICSSCKKIRDDKGYWSQVEDYITDHAGVLFSHSICPECMKKLYPGMG